MNPARSTAAIPHSLARRRGSRQCNRDSSADRHHRGGYAPHGTVDAVTDDEWLDLLTRASDNVAASLDSYDDMKRHGDRRGQYGFDLATDAVVLDVLAETGVATFSEESGYRPGSRSGDDVVIIDPVDGSSNASMGIAHYATSLAVRDLDGVRVALVVNLATGERFDAIRGRGARCDGAAISSSDCSQLSDAMVGIAGHPNKAIGWRQFRALGACALDVAYVACGRLDAFADPIGLHGLWDYAAAHLIALEAGAASGEVAGRDLLHTDHAAMRAPVYGATPELVRQLVDELGGLSERGQPI